MKKLFLSVAIAATFTLSAVAAGGIRKYDDDSKNISYYVLNQFNADFRDAENVTWTITATSQKAEFTLGETKKTAFYDLSGNYLGVTEDVAYKTIPAAARKVIAEKYQDYLPGQIIKFESALHESGFYTNLAITESPEVNYFVDLKKEGSEIMLRVSSIGDVAFFKQIK